MGNTTKVTPGRPLPEELRSSARARTDNAFMQAPRRVRRIVDALLLACLAAGLLFFWLYGERAVTTPWDWSALARAFFRVEPDQGIVPGPLGVGLINTLRLSFWTVIFASCVGLCLGLARTARTRPARVTGGVLVALTRNMPPLVLVFIVHYFLSGRLAAMADWSWTGNLPLADALLPAPARMPVFVSAVITLSLYEGAYIGEIVRAGIAGVAKEQWEAAASLGFTRFACLRRIILPQAFHFMIPPLTGQITSLIKDSAIVSVISVQELTFQGTEFMTSSGLSGEVWLAVTGCYLILCLLVSLLGRVLENRKKWA